MNFSKYPAYLLYNVYAVYSAPSLTRYALPKLWPNIYNFYENSGPYHPRPCRCGGDGGEMAL